MKTKKLSIDELLNREAQQKIDAAIVWIFFLLVGIVPLIVHATSIPLYSPTITGTMMDSGNRGDVFTYYKFFWLSIFTIAALILFLYKTVGKGYTIQKSYCNMLLLVLAAAAIGSAIFSDMKNIALFGQPNRHDGTLTYIQCLLLFFIAANVSYTIHSLKYIWRGLVIFTVVNGCLGLAYFYGYNLLENAFFRGLIVPGGQGIGSGAYISSTLNNPNYISGISGVLTATFLTRAVLDKSIRIKVESGLCSMVAFATILSSLSTSGFVTFVVILLLLALLIFFSSYRKEAIITGGGLIIAFGVVLAIMNYHNPQVWNESIGFFMDSSTNKVGAASSILSDSFFKEDRVEAANEQEDEFNLPPQQWSSGTGRTYIWSKTVQLIKERPLLGYGLDTFMYHFPQDDPGKNSGINNYEIIVDKPHNMYLGLAYGIGVFGLFAFVGLIGLYFIKGIQYVKQGINTELDVLLASLFVACCAYLIQALFNDAIIGTFIIFWILLGVSMRLFHSKNIE